MSRDRRLTPEALAPFLLEVKEGRLDWHMVFGNPQPVEVEVGFGKGMFLVAAATSRPDLNFLGIEIARKFQLSTADRLARRGLHNVRVACANAHEFFRAHVGDATVQTIHVYFPDPWWKRRHLKRRLFKPEFVVQVERILKPGGELHVVTDVEEYFGVITNIVAQHTRLDQVPVAEPQQPRHDLDYLTNFERKYRLEGRPIHRACYRKR